MPHGWTSIIIISIFIIFFNIKFTTVFLYDLLLYFSLIASVGSIGLVFVFFLFRLLAFQDSTFCGRVAAADCQFLGLVSFRIRERLATDDLVIENVTDHSFFSSVLFAAETFARSCFFVASAFTFSYAAMGRYWT